MISYLFPYRNVQNLLPRTKMNKKECMVQNCTLERNGTIIDITYVQHLPLKLHMPRHLARRPFRNEVRAECEWQHGIPLGRIDRTWQRRPEFEEQTTAPAGVRCAARGIGGRAAIDHDLEVRRGRQGVVPHFE